MPEEYRNFIDGQWIPTKSGRTFENRNPANWDEVIGLFPRSGPEDVALAIRSAQKGFQAWSRIPAPQRGEIIKRAGDLLMDRKGEIARLQTREMGKILIETRGDVQEGIDTAYYAAGEGRRLFSHHVPSELPRKAAFTVRRPVGVVGVITPWNFPMAIPCWKNFPALLCGNAVIFKPAEDTPATANALIEILLEAGVEPRAINLVHGFGEEAGRALVEAEGVHAISFTGSSEVGREIAAKAEAQHKKVSLEMGGKNAQVVLADADLELALDGVLWGAFGTSGQRCTATSRLILEGSIHDPFVRTLEERASALRVGNGLDDGTDLGPIINEKQLTRIDGYVHVGQEEGATLCLGGEVYREGKCARGWFYTPTIFTDVGQEMRIAREEIFGPVLSVFRVKDLDEAINLANNTPYGLSSAVYTKSLNAAFEAVDRLETGITYINSPTIGAEAHLPFGGLKQTGNGHREGGWPVYEFFSEIKTVYIDYSGRLQRAQIDNR